MNSSSDLFNEILAIGISRKKVDTNEKGGFLPF